MVTLLDEKKWLDWRRSHLGASESADVVGEGFAGSNALTVWERKIYGVDNVAQGDHLVIGKELEPALKRLFTYKTGIKTKGLGDFTVFEHKDPKLKFLSATPDDFVKEDGKVGIFECKNVGVWGSSDWEDGPPIRVQIQMQHQMEVCDKDFGWAMPLIGGQKIQPVRVERDRDFMGSLIPHLEAFWRGYVETKKMPPIDGSESTRDVLSRLHPKDDGLAVILPDDSGELFEELSSVSEKIKELKERERFLKNKLCAFVGDHSYGVSPDGHIFSWRHQTRKSYTVAESEFRSTRVVKNLPKGVKYVD